MINVQKKLYITIDDGPSIYTKQLVDYLYGEKIPAIWFCRGEFITPETIGSLAYVINKGFVIGNHSFSHPHFSQLTLDAAIHEIIKTENLINKAYSLAGVQRQHKIFRFPFLDKGGQIKDDVQNFLRTEGFIQPLFENVAYEYCQSKRFFEDVDVPWTFDVCDYALLSESSMKKRGLITRDDFIARLHRNDPEGGFGLNYPHSSDIVLLHDFQQSAWLFRPLIEELKRLPGSFADAFCK